MEGTQRPIVYSIRFGSSTVATFSESGFWVDGKKVVAYKDIDSVGWAAVSESVNGLPVKESLKIKITLNTGQKVSLKEEIDIRPAFMMTPVLDLFNSKKRVKAKSQVETARNQVRLNFQKVLGVLESRTGKTAQRFRL